MEKIEYTFHTPWSLKKELFVDKLHSVRKNKKYEKTLTKKFILRYLSDIDQQLYVVEDIHTAKILLHELCKYLCFGNMINDNVIYENPYVKNADKKEIEAVNKIIKSIGGN